MPCKTYDGKFKSVTIDEVEALLQSPGSFRKGRNFLPAGVCGLRQPRQRPNEKIVAITISGL